MVKRFFTFTMSHPWRNYYVEVRASSHLRARAIMDSTFGKRWGFDYDSPKSAGVEKYNLKPLPVIDEEECYYLELMLLQKEEDDG